MRKDERRKVSLNFNKNEIETITINETSEDNHPQPQRFVQEEKKVCLERAENESRLPPRRKNR